MIFPDKIIDRSSIVKVFENQMGAKVASSSDFTNEAVSEDKMDDANVFLYEDLGIALIAGSTDAALNQVQSSINAGAIIEPELVVYAPPLLVAEQANAITATCTWGIEIIKAHLSAYTGLNVPVAVLDTGFELNHPDFTGRPIVSQSFVPGTASVQDVAGHGTHCIGTACGYADASGVRYGIAYNSSIHVGKVLDDTGRGAQLWIINGIDWAAKMGCKVISMSLGSPTYPGLGFSAAYETSAANAVAKGAIVVAAAGNDSRRNIHIYNPVSTPANCPSILSVGAVGQINSSYANNTNNLEVADFSNRSITPGQDLDIAAPGVNIYSAWPLPNRYKTISGTSMATPHVAGMLALLWEKHPAYTPAQITAEMLTLAQVLPMPVIDVGAGLVGI